MKNLPIDHTALKARVCIDCGEIKPPDMFGVHKHPHAYGGYTALPRCKPCMKQYKRQLHFLRTYGISTQEYAEILIKQDNKCAICGSSGSGKESDRFVVDHCHTTGRVRGLLCWPCNIGIGMFKDREDLLKSVISYLTT